MENFWQELTKLLGIFILFAGAISWLIKSIITHFLSRDTESYKSQLTRDVENYKIQLNTEATKEIEKLKGSLQITAKEHEVRFSKLHEKRAEIISKLYSKLYQADVSVGALEIRVKDGYDETILKEAAQKAHERCLIALRFFEKNRLYLSKELSDKIHQILSTLELTSKSVSYSDSIRKNGLEIYSDQKEKIASIMESLEQEFRIMLGSESERTEELVKINNSILTT